MNLFVPTHEQHVENREIYPKYCSQSTLLRKSNFEHLLVSTKELVGLVLDGVEVVIKSC